MDRSFVAENARSRQRLRALLRRLSDRDLERELPNGWTVAAALAHLAFWDQRVLVLLRRWAQSGVGRSPIDVDATNDAILPLCLAIPPRAAGELALAAAEAVDRELEDLSDEMMSAIEGLGVGFRFRRSIHRDEHLSEIEALFQGRRHPASGVGGRGRRE